MPLNEMQRGDLLFFATDTADPATIHHVGIYIRNGMMVDARTPEPSSVSTACISQAA